MASAKDTNKARIIPEGKKQVNFNISSSTLDKVKTLAFVESVSNSDIYNRAIETYIESYERKNGKIKPVQKGRGVLP